MDSIKCVVVGDEAVGKTSCLISYTTQTLPDSYLPTVFDNLTVKLVVGGTLCSLELHDTADQEDYDRLRLLSYPQADVILVCFSVVKPASLASVRNKWLPEIARCCHGAQLLLVGTQTDRRSDAAVLQSLSRRGRCPVTTQAGRKAARKLGAAAYLECSALTQCGVKNVFDEAVTIALTPPRRSKFPRLRKHRKIVKLLSKKWLCSR